MSQTKRLSKKLVRRLYSDRYMLIMLVSFALSIVAIRFFLEITGYPQIGNSELHIAHVLWGGLFLFAGGLLPLIFANKRALDLSALLSGVGVGLFIDEIGKFITRSSDYFFPAAAPIIYVFFLLTIIVYRLVRKPVKKDLRTSIFHALEDFEELLEGDLSDIEQEKIIRRMEGADYSGSDWDLLVFKEMLVLYLEDPERGLIDHQPDLIEKLANRWSRFEKKVFEDEKIKVYIRLLWVFVGILLVTQPLYILIQLDEPLQLTGLLKTIMDSSLLRSDNFGLLGLVRISLQMLSGVGLWICAFFYEDKSADRWVKIAKVILLVILTIVNSLIFYYDQFSTLFFVLIELVILILTNRYMVWIE
jgi:hypothetical protein